MIGAIFRLFIFVLVLAALGILFFYAFVAALVITPILLLLFFLFGRKANVQWWVVSPGEGPRQPRQYSGQGPIIEHDPDALPPKNDGNP